MGRGLIQKEGLRKQAFSFGVRENKCSLKKNKLPKENKCSPKGREKKNKQENKCSR